MKDVDDLLLEHIGNRVRAERESRRWTQQELADRANMTRSNIAAIERANSAPSIPSLNKIARALGIPVSALVDQRRASAQSFSVTGAGLTEEWLRAGHRLNAVQQRAVIEMISTFVEI